MQNSQRSTIPVFIVLLLVSVFLSSLLLYAEDLSYDRYAPGGQAAPSSTGKKMAAEFLTYPFEIIRWPLDQGLRLTDRYRLDTKGKYVYQRLQDYGLTPHLNIMAPGGEVDWLTLSRQKVNFPDLTAKSWLDYWYQSIFETGTKLGIERIGGTGLHAHEIFDYSKRLHEHFYGVGPNSSQGDGTSFKQETTLLESVFGYSQDPSLSIDGKFAFKNVNISGGRDGGRGHIQDIFGNQTIDGINGDRLISFGLEAVHDTRNQQDNSTKGGKVRLGFSYNEGLGHSNVRYFHYEAEASHYFRLGSDRRVFFAHLYAEHNNEASGRSVPFYQMARLGGYGSYPDLSRTFRAYDTNRFFGEGAVLGNFEYRYTIYEHRDFKMDTVAFLDEGQVFRDFSKFQFSDFRESYGGGFRVSLLNHVLLSIEAAHGDEGTTFYVRTNSPF